MVIGLILLFCCVLLFYRAGRMEGSRKTGVLMAVLSLLVWFGTAYLISNGLPVLIMGQVVLFIGIGIYRAGKNGGFK